MIVEVGDSNMTVLVDEVGREESGEGGREGGGEVGDMGGSEEQRGEMDDNGGEAGQLALDISQLLLVSNMEHCVWLPHTLTYVPHVSIALLTLTTVCNFSTVHGIKGHRLLDLH